MDMVIDFPGGARVDAHYGPYDIMTRPNPQRVAARAKRPHLLHYSLASLGTCAGIYVLGFCQQRGLPTDGIRIIQRMYRSPATGLIGKVDMEIQVPSSFPEKYHESLIRSAQLCAVKKHLENPPEFEITTAVTD